MIGVEQTSVGMDSSGPTGTRLRPLLSPVLSPVGEVVQKHRLRPVLIGGCSRSGTTLLAAMLGVGGRNLTVPEAAFKWRLLTETGEAGPVLDLERAVSVLARDRKFRLWDVDVGILEEIGHRHDPGRVGYQALIDDLVLRYGRSVGKPHPSVWIDHTPANIRYGLTLSRLLPDARFIHVVRDGRAVAASVLPLDFGPNDVIEAARYWSSQIALGLAAADRLGPARLMTVTFEQLVTAPEVTLRTICGFLDIPYDAAMTRRRDYEVPRYTSHQHDLVAHPPDTSRVEGWRTALTSRQIETFEHVSGELLAYLGYEPVFGVCAREPGKFEHARLASVSLLRRGVGNRARRFLRRRVSGL